MTARVYQYRHLVTFDETNLVGNVYFAHYLHWQGHCRERFLGEYAPGVLREVATGELALATVSCAMDYYAECYALDQVDIAMTLRYSAGNRITMDFEFRRAEVLVARGSQTVACMRQSGGQLRPLEIPDELDTALAAFQ